MAYKIILNDNTTNNYLNNLNKYIYNNLKSIGSDVILSNEYKGLNDSEIAENFKNKYGTSNNIIILSTELNNKVNDIEIMYALRNNSRLASNINNSLISNNFKVGKYYQLRDEMNTSLDKNILIQKTKNNQTIIIYLDKIYNINDIGKALLKGISNYIGINYNPQDNNIYIVKKGDTLWSISSKNNVSIKDLILENNIVNNTIYIGQKLIIPKNNKKIYTVQKGDNLWSISRKYNTTVDNIKKSNNLKTNNLYIGQKLIINSNVVDKKIYYTVKKGDNLYNISRKYNTTVDNIKKNNNLKTNILTIGQILLIK